MVFFNGTLQEGISTALQQSKFVVCFVTDDQEESKIWETEFLTDDSIAPALDKEAVVLRLEAGTQEAGYLAAIFPLPQNPTLVIIRDGQMKEYLSAGTSKPDFVSKVTAALSAHSGQDAQPAAPVAATLETAAQPPISPAAATTTTPTATNNDQAAQLLNEAERRREAARKEREAIEKERRRKAKGKQPATQQQKDSDDARKKASQQLAERQRQAREERARVLQRIEDDKAERKARQERARQDREGKMGGNAAEPMAAATNRSSPMTVGHDQCAVQVRLFDGSTIRTRFGSKATLGKDVRGWIDESRTDGMAPYTFKVILTPLPNRSIEQATEEELTLEELGLAPSATLVLTPVDQYSDAYMNVNAGLTSPVSRVFTAVMTFVVTLLGGIAGALGGLGSGVGGGGGADASGSDSGQAEAASQQDRGQTSGAAAAATGRDGGGSGRIKGFQNPDDQKKDYQLYNGNSLNFEPRKDEDDKDK